jgi:N utilization substance protein B
MNNNNNNDDDFKSENFDQDFELDPVEIEDDFEDLEDFEDDNRLPLKKRNHRVLLFHILYAADIYDFETPVEKIVENFNREYETGIDFDSDIISTVKKIGVARKELDSKFIPFLKNWKYERIGYCTILILRYAIWELMYSDVHHSIIINEAIELAKSFAEKDAFKFVNGILDKISKKIMLEKVEIQELHASQDSIDFIEEKEDVVIEKSNQILSAEEIIAAALATIDEEESE